MRIGELAKRAGCDVETVRYYEREGLLAEPERESSGYRCYGASHLETLQFLRHGRSLGMKLAEIQMLLDFRRHPDGDCAGVNTLLDVQIGRVEAQIVAMGVLKKQLLVLRAECEERQTNRGCGILRSLNQAARGQGCPCHQEESR
ncbi:MAG: Cd(II)/Pb(II)-responsive transcriptional regulator [Magnetococcales bacterium]|nr:Cd(II)/Pb(II)-responsive transcriptional regulator [Magnetococcales bacterium]